MLCLERTSTLSKLEKQLFHDLDQSWAVAHVERDGVHPDLVYDKVAAKLYPKVARVKPTAVERLFADLLYLLHAGYHRDGIVFVDTLSIYYGD